MCAAAISAAPVAKPLPLPVRLGLAVCGASLVNAVSLGFAWILGAESAVVILSATQLALSAPMAADVAWRASHASGADADARLGFAPLQLILDTACCVLMAVDALEGLSWLRFTHAGAAGLVRAVLPVACCAWVCRLAVVTPAWAEHARALVAREAAVARVAAAGMKQRLLDSTATSDASWRGAAEMLAARSGVLWHRLTATLSLLDWALVATLWAVMEPVVESAADAAAAAWFLPAFLALDSARIGAQLLHGLASGAAAKEAPWYAMLLPAGVVTRLSATLFIMNAGCSAALLALAQHVPETGAWHLLPRCVLAARFLRLVCECAYLVAGAEARAPPPVPLQLHAVRDLDAACDAVGAATVTCAPDWTVPPLAQPAWPPPASEQQSLESATPQRARAPRIGLDAFSSLVMAGVRGYLRGDDAAAAVERIFSEADVDASGEVTAEEIGSWVAREPADGGGVQWRASVRRVLDALPLLSLPPMQAAAPPSSLPVPLPPPVQEERPASPRYRPRGLRLLSLEGGGIKGLALIWQLMHIERATGRPIHDLFDLIGGTSTGGILALALANRIPLARLEAMYLDVAREVFAPASLWRQLRHGNSADNGPLLKIVQDALGRETPMRGGDARPAAFVVTTRQEAPAGGAGAGARLELRVIRTYNSGAPSGGRDAREGWRQWEAAMATSAAPTILPPFTRGDGSTFVDGALSGNNNPSLLVLTEGLQLARGRPVDILLSLGCGEVPGSAATPERGSGVLFWLGQVVNLAFDTIMQEERTVRLLEQVCPAARYLRLSPALRVDCALAEHRPEALAALREDTLAHLAAHAEDVARLSTWLAQDDVEDETGGGFLLPGGGQLSEAMLL